MNKKTISIRFSEEELTKIGEQAEKRGIDRSKYIRNQILNMTENSKLSLNDTQIRKFMMSLNGLYDALGYIKDNDQIKYVKVIQREIETLWQSVN